MILLFVKICLPIFPFDVWDKLLVLIRPVPGVFLLFLDDKRVFTSHFSSHKSNYLSQKIHIVKAILL